MLGEVQKLQEHLRTEYEVATSELRSELCTVREEKAKLAAQLAAAKGAGPSDRLRHTSPTPQPGARVSECVAVEDHPARCEFPAKLAHVSSSEQGATLVIEKAHTDGSSGPYKDTSLSTVQTSRAVVSAGSYGNVGSSLATMHAGVPILRHTEASSLATSQVTHSNDFLEPCGDVDTSRAAREKASRQGCEGGILAQAARVDPSYVSHQDIVISDDAGQFVSERSSGAASPDLPFVQVSTGLRRKRLDADDVARKLRTRLGVHDDDDVITDGILYQAVCGLGLTKHDRCDMRDLITRMDVAYRSKKKVAKEGGRSSSRIMGERAWFGLPSLCSSKPALEIFPDPRPAFHYSKTGLGWETTIPFMHFAEMLVDRERWPLLGSKCSGILRTVSDVLISGDTNRLVAELTNTLIDDLASPPPAMDLQTTLEPCACFLIVLNGALLGVQANPSMEDWVGWLYIEAVFILLFIMEFLVRLACAGPLKHFTGQDWIWSYFDLSIIAFAIVDLVVQVTGANLPGSGCSTALRLFRLTRLTRIMRILRFQMFRELTLMLKGLLGGLRTLGWAMVLLMTAIYVIAVFLTSLLPGDEGILDIIPEAADYFSDVGLSMFVAFRCLTGDCTDAAGRSLVVLMSARFGLVFTVPYVLLVMLVTFGIFNLIMAIYVESTLSAARKQDDADKKRCLRVAHAAKQLIRRFRAARRRFGTAIQEAPEEDDDDLDDDCWDDPEVVITRELFLYAIQDRKVQSLMDDLEIQSDRAHLFEVFDARGDGMIPLTQLIQSLLKVRGEPCKSDMVACLIAVQALKDSVLLPNKSGASLSKAGSLPGGIKGLTGFSARQTSQGSRGTLVKEENSVIAASPDIFLRSVSDYSMIGSEPAPVHRVPENPEPQQQLEQARQVVCTL